MGETPNYLFSLLDNGEKWRQDEHVNGTEKEYEGKTKGDEYTKWICSAE
jgi:hypothetical protein